MAQNEPLTRMDFDLLKDPPKAVCNAPGGDEPRNKPLCFSYLRGIGRAWKSNLNSKPYLDPPEGQVRKGETSPRPALRNLGKGLIQCLYDPLHLTIIDNKGGLNPEDISVYAPESYQHAPF